MAELRMPPPSMSQIGVTQDLDVNIRRKLASGSFYRTGKRLHFGGASVAIVLALASPVVLLLAPDAGPALGAVAGAWIFVSRIVLEPFKREFQLKGATAQELFDCAVLGFEWNDALVRRMAEEEIRKASGSMKGAARMRRWYPADKETAWPASVLLCQRANAVWARRQHVTYGRGIAAAAVAWLIIGIVIGVADSASLAEYLTTVALPSLPAFLDAAEMSRRHREAANKRQMLEGQTDALLRSGNATNRDLREIQDQLFTLRLDEPLVPEWFYKLVKPNYDQDMRYAAELAAQGHSPVDTPFR